MSDFIQYSIDRIDPGEYPAAASNRERRIADVSTFTIKTAVASFSHRTVAASAADAIRRKIFDGELNDGEPLRQDLLAAEFGISRTPIREALVQLEAEGLIRIEPHKGAVVRGASVVDIDETFELRGILEPMLLERSAPELTPADFEHIEAILNEYSAELRNHNVRRWGELNTLFHSTLYARAQRPQMQAIVDKLLIASDRYTRLQLLHTDGLKRAEREHAQIVELCRKRRFGAAAELVGRHIRVVKASLLSLVARTRGAGPSA